MSSFLDQVIAERRADVAARPAGALDAAKAAAATTSAPRGFGEALRAPGISLIAELKRASPSAGPIAPDVDRLAAARAYAAAGAAAVSVLTEPLHFDGSLDDLTTVRAEVAIPVLRKDFIVSPLQVWEARSAGADAALLIVAALTDAELSQLVAEVSGAGMDALVEIHTRDEVARAIDAGATIIGINTRNLATLKVDTSVVAQIRPHVPSGVIVVGESGISTRQDVISMEEAGCDAVLIGEALMRAPDPEAKVRELIGR